MTYSLDNVFCDWLDVTYSPGNSSCDRLHLWLDTLCCPVTFSDRKATKDDDGAVAYSTDRHIQVGSGILVIQRRNRFHRVSASGGVLSYLRETSNYLDFLSVLSECPHKVTRLDAALDLPIDAPLYLRRLESRYPDDWVNLQRKALRVTRLYSARLDGQQTGTWYAGHRSKARVVARVYDKQNEALEKRGEVIPATTRIELTFAKDHGCTLKDAAMPYSLFYTHASPALIERPEGLSDWEPHGEGWEPVSAPVVLPIELIKRRLETSPEIDRLVELCGYFGPEAEDYLLRVFQNRLRMAFASKNASSA